MSGAPQFPERTGSHLGGQRKFTIISAIKDDVELRATALATERRCRQDLTRIEAELGAATMAYYDANVALDDHLLDLADVMGLDETYNCPVPAQGYQEAES